MDTPSRRQELRAEAWLLLVVFIWAANYPLAKWAISGMDVSIFNAIRFVTAAAVGAGMLLIKRTWAPVAAGTWPRIILVGIIAHVAYQIVFLIGLNMTSAGNTAVLLSTAPLWTLVISAKMHRERMGKLVWIGMIVSLAGISFILFGTGQRLDFGGAAMIGDLIALSAAILWAFHTNLQKPLLAGVSVFQLTFLLLSIGGIGLTIAAVPHIPSFPWGSTRWTYYLAAVASGAFSIAIGNVLWSNGVKRLGPGRTSNFNNLIPVVAFALSYLTLHEPVSAVQIAGVSVTIFGVWLARR